MTILYYRTLEKFKELGLERGKDHIRRFVRPILGAPEHNRKKSKLSLRPLSVIYLYLFEVRLPLKQKMNTGLELGHIIKHVPFFESSFTTGERFWNR